MSESLDGLISACTRQNAGRSLNIAGLPPKFKENDPAATICDEVMAVSGSFSALRLSHGVPAARAGNAPRTTSASSKYNEEHFFCMATDYTVSRVLRRERAQRRISLTAPLPRHQVLLIRVHRTHAARQVH